MAISSDNAMPLTFRRTTTGCGQTVVMPYAIVHGHEVPLSDVVSASVQSGTDEPTKMTLTVYIRKDEG